MIIGESVVVDWARRRVLRLADELTATHCTHHSRLSEFCPSCNADIDAWAIDLSA